MTLASARGFARVDFEHIPLSCVSTVYDLNTYPDFDTDLSHFDRNLAFNSEPGALLRKSRNRLRFWNRFSGCPISGYADGGLEVHSVPLLRQPHLTTFLLTYLPTLPTDEVSSQMRDQEQIYVGSDPSSIFEIRLKQEVEKKRPESINRKGVAFHHDNARPYTSLAIRQILKQLGWEALMHPTYSSDLEPPDFHLPLYK
ncbi:Mariner Mos1 transposase [Eumeta japonica]|uniref:Mariner Mos1 transposase n=1 Tax=Eumeta variegata TaxID=151549 RepID=A0A4C1VLQ1_EUMVA|nr:Mariner Mos1 transposase [Eumeta japonica]